MFFFVVLSYYVLRYLLTKNFLYSILQLVVLNGAAYRVRCFPAKKLLKVPASFSEIA